MLISHFFFQNQIYVPSCLCLYATTQATFGRRTEVEKPVAEEKEEFYSMELLKLLSCVGGLLTIHGSWGLMPERTMTFKFGQWGDDKREKSEDSLLLAFFD